MSKPKPTQRTRPKKGKPMEIPVPKREDVLRDLDKLMQDDREKPAGRRTSTSK